MSHYNLSHNVRVTPVGRRRPVRGTAAASDAHFVELRIDQLPAATMLLLCTDLRSVAVVARFG